MIEDAQLKEIARPYLKPNISTCFNEAPVKFFNLIPPKIGSNSYVFGSVPSSLTRTITKFSIRIPSKG